MGNTPGGPAGARARRAAGAAKRGGEGERGGGRRAATGRGRGRGGAGGPGYARVRRLARPWEAPPGGPGRALPRAGPEERRGGERPSVVRGAQASAEGMALPEGLGVTTTTPPPPPVVVVVVLVAAAGALGGEGAGTAGVGARDGG